MKKTFDEYIPDVKQSSNFFGFPNLKNSIFSYLFLILSFILCIGIAIYIVQNKIKNYEFYYIDLANKQEKVKTEVEDIINNTKKIMSEIGYNEKQIEAFNNFIIKRVNYEEPLSIAEIDKSIEEQKERWEEGQKTIKNSIYKNVPDEEVPTYTDDGEKFLEAKKLVKPLNLRSDYLLVFKNKALASINKANQVKTEVLDIFNNYKNELEKKNKIKDDQQKKEIEKELAKEQNQQQKEVDIKVQEKPKTQQVIKETPKVQPQQPAKQPETEPKQSEVPSW